jgi:hypothetical protein
MPKISEEVFYDGAKEKLERLGLGPLFEEIRSMVTRFSLRVKEEKDANGGAAVRKPWTHSSRKLGAGRKDKQATSIGLNAELSTARGSASASRSSFQRGATYLPSTFITCVRRSLAEG